MARKPLPRLDDRKAAQYARDFPPRGESMLGGWHEELGGEVAEQLGVNGNDAIRYLQVMLLVLYERGRQDEARASGDPDKALRDAAEELNAALRGVTIRATDAIRVTRAIAGLEAVLAKGAA